MNFSFRNCFRSFSGSALLLAFLLSPAVLGAATGAGTRPSGLALPSDQARWLSILQQTDAPVAQKAVACQQLALIGSPETFTTLARWLNDPQLAVQARNVLENAPMLEAARVLRDALPKLDGTFLAGVVNSLGTRRDTAAVPALLALARDPSRGVTAESLLALGRIASPEAVAALQIWVSDPTAITRAAAAEACLLAAEALPPTPGNHEKIALFDAARFADVPAPLQLAALRGSILARRESGIPLLLEQFKSTNPETRRLASRVARELTGNGVGPALAGELATAPTSVQCLLLHALRDRGDAQVAESVERLTGSSNPDVRIAALQALATVGAPSSVAILLKHVVEPTVGDAAAPESDAAAASLVQRRETDADAAILAALPGAPPTTRARLVTLLGQRHATGATAELLRQAADPDPTVAKASFDALAAVARLPDLPQIIRVAVHRPDPGVRDRAERALYGICLQQTDVNTRSQPLAVAYQEIPDTMARASLLQVMAMLGDPAGARGVAIACDDPDRETRDLALRLLANWPDTTPMPTLLRIYQTSTNSTHRTLVLRGIVTLSGLWKGDHGAALSGSKTRTPPAEVLAWLTQAQAALRDDPEEKKIFISGLGDVNSPDGLRLLAPYLEDPSVRHEAGLAYLRAYQGLASPEHRVQAKPALERIAAQTEDADLRRQARSALDLAPRTP